MSITRDVKKLDDSMWSPIAKWAKYLSLLNAIRFDGDVADFLIWNTNHWTITKVEAGYGSASAALANVQGGVLQVINAGGDNDSYQAQLKGEPFKLLTGKFTYFEAKFKASEKTQIDLLFGLCITDTTLIAGMSDGVYWRKDDGDAYLDCVSIKNGSPTAKTQIGSLVADTWIRLGFYFDGYSTITPFINGTEYTAQNITTNLANDEELTPSFAIMNGEAAAKTLDLDYIFAVQAR